MSFLIKNGLMLKPDEVVLSAWATERLVWYMKGTDATEVPEIERLSRMYRSVADQYLAEAMSEVRHDQATSHRLRHRLRRASDRARSQHGKPQTSSGAPTGTSTGSKRS